MKKLIIIPLGIVLLFAVAAVGYLLLMTGLMKAATPPSFQITYAAIAGCKNQQEIQQNDGALFQGFDYLAPYIPYLLRWDQMLFNDHFVITDGLVSNQSVFHILLTASELGESECDEQIMSLAQHYQSRGAYIDQFNDYGMTPLQEAVITRNENFVRFYSGLGANKHLKTKSNIPLISGKDVDQIVRLLREKAPDDLKLARIETLLK
ncbi:hypothetical protein [Amphritea pacifica]|uniref:Ankyrin repeat domain-containing protein n=1 Tax=Amphritea pacifica TaxID=2811233 RepID=A0ABS2WCU6_9GAMM|nr:hypothetical protein [Amphritea pacifica]MBN0989513.1 hypothetical protein [Amphritea pacifica]MBN1005081.1 hypothetical protein [Amphritea pacifica]